MGIVFSEPAVKKMGENITREWQREPFANEVADALELLKEGKGDGLQDMRSLSESGSALAMMYLGSTLLNGRYGVPSEPASGEKWLKQAIKFGSIEAEFVLAVYYSSELRIDEALSHYNHLSDLGYSPAQYHLAYLHMRGEKVTKNLEKAVSFYRKAADNGHYEARLALCILLMKNRMFSGKWLVGLFKKLTLALPYARMKVCYPNSDKVRY